MSFTEKEEIVSELLCDIRAGKEEAIGKLLNIYNPLIEAKAAEFSEMLEPDDIRQLCAIGIFEAAQSYSETKAGDKVTFGLYAKICVRNRLLSELRKLGPALETTEEEPASQDISPEEEFIRREEISSALESAYSRLTEYENLVLQLYLAGKSYSEVAKILNRPLKSVDNAMSRIRSKLRNLL